jgi:hypothetical protein
MSLQVPFSDLTFGAEPNIPKTLSIGDTLIEETDHIRPPTYVGVNQCIDEFRAARRAFGIQLIEGDFKAVEIDAGMIFGPEH